MSLYYMASSTSGQAESNPTLWLATRAGKMELSRSRTAWPSHANLSHTKICEVSLVNGKSQHCTLNDYLDQCFHVLFPFLATFRGGHFVSLPSYSPSFLFIGSHLTKTSRSEVDKLLIDPNEGTTSVHMTCWIILAFCLVVAYEQFEDTRIDDVINILFVSALLDKNKYVCMGYWPIMRSRWLDIGQLLFC